MENKNEISDRTPGKNLFARGKSAELGSFWGIAGTMGLHMVSCPLIGAALGYALDRWLGTGFLFPAMLVLGIIAGFRCVWQDMRKLQRLEERGRQAGQQGDRAG